MTVIDTPGLGEEDIEKEVKLMYEIVEKIKSRVKLVHVFIIVLNGEKTVLEEKDESLIRIFTKIFGNQIWNNVMLQASKWRFSEDGYHMREQQAIPINESLWTEQWKNTLNVTFDTPVSIFSILTASKRNGILLPKLF